MDPRRHLPRPRAAPAALLPLLLAAAWAGSTHARMLAQWATHGSDLYNRRWAEGERRISPSTVGSLTLKWQFQTGGDVTATPAVFQRVVYFPDWAGSLYAVSERTGELVWKKSFAGDYGFPEKTFSRATPAIAPRRRFAALAEDILVIGTSIPAVVIAVSLKNGSLIWKTVVDDSAPAAKITGAATILKEGAYVGVASDEEGAAADPSYKCCTFKGSLVKLSLLTGEILWKAYTLPAEPGYAGGAIWAATPAIDVRRQLVFAGVGNMYTLPDSVEKCIQENPNRTSPDPCIVPGNHQDAIIAVNTSSGIYKWSRSLGAVDASTLACGDDNSNPSPNCPKDPGPDYDFGLNPLLISIPDPRPGRQGQNVDVAIAGQKSGIVFALHRSTGDVIWSVQAGPGGSLGGVSWGMATDGAHVFVGIMNNKGKPFYIPTTNSTITSGAWVALNASTGAPIWYTPNPSTSSPNWAMLPSVANGVVFAGSPDKDGHVYGLDAASGKVLWDFKAGTSVYGGVSINRGCIFFGHGYGAFTGPFGTTGGGPQSVYAFCVPKSNPIMFKHISYSFWP